MKRVWDALVGAARQFGDHDGWAHSSHIALSLILAIFPFCLFTLALASQFSTALNTDDIVEFLLGTWPEEISEPLVRELYAVLASSDASILTVNALLAIFFASNGIEAIRAAITDAYHFTDPRPAWRMRMVCIIFVILGSVLFVLAGLLTVALPLYFKFVQAAAPGVYKDLFQSDGLRATITLLVLLVMVISFHLWLPNKRRPITELLPGVALTVVLWAIASQGFAFYLSTYATYSVTYAGLASVMSTLVFLNLMAAIFIFGAEFNGQWTRPPVEP